MKINRDNIRKSFAQYTDNYNASDPKIKLKIDHTYRVAAISARIAKSLDCSEEDVDLAWLIGMLHDIGRFEQLRRFGTFSDAASINHAQFGVKLLFEENLLRQFLPEKFEEESVIHDAIWNHNAYRIDENLDERTKQFCHILRDADKIDILKVNYEVPLEDIYNISKEEIMQSTVTPEVMEAFFEHHAVLQSLKKTAVDNIVGHAGLVFELVYPVSYEIVQQQGYLKKLLSFSSENSMTRQQFQELRECMEMFLKCKMSGIACK
jgi:putative nucleotidyltransferase with HDIG domain